MKTRDLLKLVVALSMSLPAQARQAESADSTQGSVFVELKQTWDRLSQETQKTASSWMAALEQKWNNVTGRAPASDTAVAAPANAIATAAVNPTAVANVAPTGTNNAAPALVVAPETTAAVPAAKVAAAPASTTQTPEQKQLSDVVNNTKQAITGKDAFTVAAPARAGTTALPKTASGVPSFALSHTEKDKKKKTLNIVVKNIPKLDIGAERQILASEFVPSKDLVGLKKPVAPKALPSPEVASEKATKALTKEKLVTVTSAQKPKRGEFELGSIVTHQKIDGVSLEMSGNKPVEQDKAVKDMSADELTLLTAAILFEKKDKCHFVSGILADLSEKEKSGDEANYFMGICAHQMGFNSEAISRLIKVVKSERADLVPDAVTNLVENLPRQYDQEVVPVIRAIKTKTLIPDKSKDDVHFVTARWANEKGNYQEAVEAAEAVSEKNSHYAEAQYFKGIALYGAKQVKDAEGTLTDLRSWMTKKGKDDKNLEALIAVNLARMMFTQGDYQKAHEEYLKVPKDHPVWVQALIEQGWTQLNLDDAPGAIGNMYSLHSPYFKSVFMPESWIVRTIGYIDICQYGDAYKTLTRMEQMHLGWQAKVKAYLAAKKNPNDYYETVKNYIRGKSDRDVDGLPSQVIREIGRQRGFLNSQEALNTLEDEIAQYSFIYNIVKKDQADLVVKTKRVKDRLAKLKSDIASTKTHKELVANLNDWNAQRRNDENLLSAMEFQSAIYEKARVGFLKMKGLSLARIDKKKASLRTEAGTQLIAHLKDVDNRVSEIMEGNEFLRYEIFSGSGENIRYQVAGGATEETHRIPANVKPQKILNWEFDGEYWEDEIGSYRSTLKNNCPKSVRSHAELGGAAHTTTAKNE